MIRGVVNARLEAVVRLRVRGPGGAESDVDVIDDGTIVTRNRVTFIAFDRKSASLEQAIRSATANVRAAGLEVERVEMPALV